MQSQTSVQIKAPSFDLFAPGPYLSTGCPSDACPWSLSKFLEMKIMNQKSPMQSRNMLGLLFQFQQLLHQLPFLLSYIDVQKMPNKTCKTFHQNMQNMRNQGTSISCVAEGSLDKNAKKNFMIIFFKLSHFGGRFKQKAKSLQGQHKMDGQQLAPLHELPEQNLQNLKSCKTKSHAKSQKSCNIKKHVRSMQSSSSQTCTTWSRCWWCWRSRRWCWKIARCWKIKGIGRAGLKEKNKQRARKQNQDMHMSKCNPDTDPGFAFQPSLKRSCKVFEPTLLEQ